MKIFFSLLCSILLLSTYCSYDHSNSNLDLDCQQFFDTIQQYCIYEPEIDSCCIKAPVVNDKLANNQSKDRCISLSRFHMRSHSQEDISLMKAILMGLKMFFSKYDYCKQQALKMIVFGMATSSSMNSEIEQYSNEIYNFDNNIKEFMNALRCYFDYSSFCLPHSNSNQSIRVQRIILKEKDFLPILEQDVNRTSKYPWEKEVCKVNQESERRCFMDKMIEVLQSFIQRQGLSDTAKISLNNFLFSQETNQIEAAIVVDKNVDNISNNVTNLLIKNEQDEKNIEVIVPNTSIINDNQNQTIENKKNGVLSRSNQNQDNVKSTIIQSCESDNATLKKKSINFAGMFLSKICISLVLLLMCRLWIKEGFLIPPCKSIKSIKGFFLQLAS